MCWKTPVVACVETKPGNTIDEVASRADSDESYVNDICDGVLGERASRQHRFDWLRGDPGKDGIGRALPVDAFYARHRLVIEYRERQHDEANAFFDKPDRLTISGVHRGEQRRRYDALRETLIPARGLRLLIVRPTDLEADSRGRLRRDRPHDLDALGRLISAATAL
jgi:hypothetical protein